MNSATVTLFVCVTCRNPEDASARPGLALYGRLAEAALTQPDRPIALRPIECLSVCKRPCTLAFAGDHRWTYVIGDIEPDLPAGDILATARQFGAAEDGIIPWRERPLWYRKGVVSRVPPPGPASRPPED